MERLVKCMKNKRFGSIVFSVCMVAFVSGIITGYMKNREEKEEDILPSENVQAVLGEEETAERIVVKEAEYFRIKASEDYVMLYEVFNDKTENEIERCRVDKSFLPESEVQILEEGIDFFDKEEALMVMESFIS